MQNTEIFRHPKSSKLSLYVPIQLSPKLSASFPTLYAKYKHCNTRSATPNLLDIPLAIRNMYGKNSIKNLCIRDWNNFKRDFSNILDSELSLSKIKAILNRTTMVNTELYHHYLPSNIDRNQYQQYLKSFQTQL